MPKRSPLTKLPSARRAWHVFPFIFRNRWLAMFIYWLVTLSLVLTLFTSPEWVVSYCMLSGLVMLPIIVVMGMDSATFAARLTNDEDYELIKLTSLSNEQLAWGMWQVMMQKFRGSLLWWRIMVPIIFVAINLLISYILAANLDGILYVTRVQYTFFQQPDQPISFSWSFFLLMILINFFFVGLVAAIVQLGLALGSCMRNVLLANLLVLTISGCALLTYGIQALTFLSEFVTYNNFNENNLDVYWFTISCSGVFILAAFGVFRFVNAQFARESLTDKMQQR